MTAIAAWLDNSVPELEQSIVRRAMRDIGIVEMPPGSNRSPTIDGVRWRSWLSGRIALVRGRSCGVVAGLRRFDSDH